ncbi:MarR family winged helix-turn-helix transcriptional regulator [Lysinibacter cavernae]|uniref:DNA-binding MarR family transcriptional regulator n=1 Tax=Lysinibacter cavernae TaxID=1640652 RepID=A0A7X5R0G4_9MICO|nr:DNA-binding MarR family transcriptional regulator [Lysinibacter cavernae]
MSIAGSRGGDQAATEPVAAEKTSKPGIRLTNEAWESLFQAQVTLMREFSSEKIWNDLSMREYDVLYSLTKGPDCGMRPADLNESILLSQPSLSRMIDRLEQRGLVRRNPDPTDGRSLNVTLTDAGRSIQREVGRKHAATVAKHMGNALSETQLHQLIELCTTLQRKHS